MSFVACQVTPILLMDWVYGSEKVDQLPGSGGGVVIAVFPVAVILGIAVAIVLVRFVYRRISRSESAPFVR